MKKIIISLGFAALALGATAQVKIKDGSVTGSSTTPNSNAILELESNNKGLLYPRVALVSTDNFAPLTAHVKGMIVYDTVIAGTGATAVSPGLYYNDGTQWVRATQPNDWYKLGTTIPAGNTDSQYVMGSVGIGTTTPGARLEVNNGATNGAIKIVDGTQAVGKVLTSDAGGTGTWQLAALKMVIGNKGAGVDIPLSSYPAAANSPGESGTAVNLYTGTTITLPPGKWKVDLQMLMRLTSIVGGASGNSYIWLRTTFSDSPTTLATSGDIDAVSASGLISGLAFPGRPYAFLQGYVLINNISGADKTYYYYVQSLVSDAVYSSLTISNFGGSAWGEDVLVATPTQSN